MKKVSGKIVSGIRADLLRVCILINILFLAFASLKNPVLGIKNLKRIREKRQKIHGLPKIKKLVYEGKRYFFSENIPGWPSAAFNGYFRTEILRTSGHYVKVPLSTIIFAITSKCRLGCEHCYEWHNLSHNDKLSPDDLKNILMKIKAYGVNHIQLSGGEPLERFDDLTDLLLLSGRSADLWLLTSGFGLTREKAFSLRKAGLTGANISLDHWDENEHNRSRNNSGSFSWAKEAVKNCREAEIATTLSLCAFRSFVSSDNLVKYADLAKVWGAGFIRILEPKAAGRYKGKDISLGIKQIEVLEEFYQHANSSYKFKDYPIVTYPGYHQRRIGCLGAGNRYLYIDSVGDIHACPFCQRIAGNAVSDTIEEAVAILRTYGCQEYKMNISD